MPKTKTAKTPIDWAATHARLAAAASAAAGKTGGAVAETALLARRAKALATPEKSAAEAEKTIEVVAFELGGQAFGLEATQVREAVMAREVTALPGVPPFVRGLVNIRSRVVPVFDLKPLLHLRAPAGPAEEKILVVAADGSEFGLVVERVLGLRSVAPGRLRIEVPGLDAKHLRGLTDDGLILLELSALLPDLTVDDGGEA